MFSRAAIRTASQAAGRRGFHSTRTQMSSPYHYPEGPYTNLPFNPKKKGFHVLFWGYAITGFGLPFGIAGASASYPREVGGGGIVVRRWLTVSSRSMANLQAPHVSCDQEWSCGCGLVYDGDGVEFGPGRRGAGAWIDSAIDVFSNRVFLGLHSVHTSGRASSIFSLVTTKRFKFESQCGTASMPRDNADGSSGIIGWKVK